MYAAKYLKPVPDFDAKAIEKLKHYNFPGNVRELQYTMERAVIMSEGEILSAARSYFFPHRISCTEIFRNKGPESWCG